MILIYELVQIKVLHVACKSTGVDEKIEQSFSPYKVLV